MVSTPETLTARQMTKKVRDLTETQFRYFETAHDFTQFVRGELYMFIDSILTLFNVISADDLPAIFEFVEHVLQMILQWMELFRKQYIEYYTEAQQNPKLFLVDIDAAIASAGPELFNVLGKLFGDCPRARNYMLHFRTQLLYQGDKNFADREQLKGNCLRMSYLNKFGSMDGFAAILLFIRHKSINGEHKKSMPLQMVERLLIEITPVLYEAEKAFAKELMEDIRKALMERLTNISESEIKELDRDIIKKTLDTIRSYHKAVYDATRADETVELLELQLAEKFIRSPFLERRVRGINDLKVMVSKVSTTSTRDRITRWLDPDKYSNWLI